MKLLFPTLIAFTLTLSACGGRESGESTAPEVVRSAGLGVDISALPDPCALLTSALASEALKLGDPEQRNLSNEAAVSRICNYSDASGESKKVLLMSLTMVGSAAMSSALDSRQELVSKASRLAGGLEPSAVRNDLGNIAFVFDQDTATRLQILTGLGGTSGDSGEVTSELQLGYAINFPEMPAAERQELLVKLAQRHIKALTAGVKP